MANYDNTPWDDGVYETGHTRPPKSRGGLIAVLLICMIFLTGLVTVMGLMNIRMFRQLTAAQEETAPAISFDQDETEDAGDLLTPIELEESPTSPPNVPEAEGLSLQEIYRQCIASVVSITSSSGSGTSTGTGVILSEDGYIVTNYHVIEDGTRITVLLHDDREFSAWIVGSDPATDLAVLKIEADDLTGATFGDSDVLQVGDSVAAIGDPLGIEYRGTMTNGIISAINRNMNIDGRLMNLIQTNAALNSGNSGGPLINSYGQVIGINTVKIGAFTDKAGVEGIGFAIPSATVTDIVNQIIEMGYVSGRPSIGFSGEGISLFYQRFYRLPSGMYITDITPGSNAEQVGLQEGDILISVDGTKVYDQSDLDTLLYGYAAGDTVTIIIYRGGYTMQASLTLEEAGNVG